MQQHHAAEHDDERTRLLDRDARRLVKRCRDASGPWLHRLALEDDEGTVDQVLYPGEESLLGLDVTVSEPHHETEGKNHK